MDCVKVQEILSEYADNLLDDDTKMEIEKHLNECESCRKEYELLKNIIASCGKLDEEDLPNDFDHALHEQLLSVSKDKEKEGLFKRFGRHGTITAAAAAVLIVSLGVVFGSGILYSGPKNSAPAGGALPKSASMRTEVQNSLDSSVTYGIQSSQDGIQGSGETGGNAGDNRQTLTAGKQSEIIVGTSIDMSCKNAVINIAKIEYDKYYKDITAEVEGMQGYLKQENPAVFALPKGSWEALVKKLNDSYNIYDISVSSKDIAGEYSSLQADISNLEKKLNEPSEGTRGEDIENQLADRRKKIIELDEEINYIIIQINILQ